MFEQARYLQFVQRFVAAVTLAPFRDVAGTRPHAAARPKLAPKKKAA